MENLLTIEVALILLALTASKTSADMPESILESGPNSIKETILGVFKQGEHETTTIKLKKSHSSAPPHSLHIVSPKKPGLYPVLFFIHGTMLPNHFYSDLFEHVASHGFVLVAPQIYLSIPMPYHSMEIERAVSVANWLVPKLDTVLPELVKGDLTKLAVSGHSRGAKTAFALALGKHYAPLTVKISAVIGLDPVAGTSKDSRTKPYILTYVPDSFDLSIPATIIGTGLGNQSKFPNGLSCAPNGVNHEEFYNECKEDCTHFVVSEYGHMDMLNKNVTNTCDLPLWGMMKIMCVSGKGDRDLMRSTVGGIMVAFLDAYFLDDTASFATILADPSVAPAKLNPVRSKGKINQQAQRYAYAQV